MHTLKLTQIGNSVGAIFPKELLTRLDLTKGDELYVTDSPDGLRFQNGVGNLIAIMTN